MRRFLAIWLILYFFWLVGAPDRSDWLRVFFLVPVGMFGFMLFVALLTPYHRRR